jgi:hypothetical protein
VADDHESVLPEAPRLPQRAAIYITPDGSVKFGALFEDLVPVAAAVSGAAQRRPPDSAPLPDPDIER